MSLQAALQALSQGQNVPPTGLDASGVTGTQLPSGVAVSYQPQANCVPLPRLQNPTAHTPAEILTALSQAIQNTNPADLQTFLTQLHAQATQASGTLSAAPLSHSVPAVGGQLPPPGLEASDFMYPSPSTAATRTPRPSHSSLDPPSSIPCKRRKSTGGTPSSVMSSRNKGKERAYSPEPPLKQSRRSGSYSDDDEMQSSLPQASGPLPNSDEVFVDGGEQLVFWVQMETKQRGDLLQMIKRNGGKIVAEILDADYAVLAQNSKPFEHWLKLATQANVAVVQSRYIYESVKQSALLDADEYGFEDVPKRKRGRPRKDPQVSTPTNASKKRSPTKTKAPTSAGPSSQPQPVPERASSSQTVRASQSPPPPQNPLMMESGRYRYTTEEWEYAQRYIPILFARDPDMSMHTIASKLHDKMPHHPIMSWLTWIGKDPRSSTIAQARKRAHIQWRKAAQQKPVPQLGDEQTNAMPAAPQSSLPTLNETALPEPPANAPESASQLGPEDARDFDFFAQFLADGGADGRSDPEVWALLAKERPSRTAEEWHVFWGEHGQAIDDVVQRLMKETDASEQQAS
ncbi:hypothetical protein EVJ58_g6529 [Rhodofomes roseus]|uniref:BRCT domain-containing protein n=1 Tax=Rhodofomes roseus TaxID=34475 RepID=A0A4Y9Y913_9APHY|nr:hypothetical protein EVJ58_g6529 [Rhodofomes roseus]